MLAVKFKQHYKFAKTLQKIIEPWSGMSMYTHQREDLTISKKEAILAIYLPKFYSSMKWEFPLKNVTGLKYFGMITTLPLFKSGHCGKNNTQLNTP